MLVHGDFGDGFESWGPACELIGKRRRTVVIDRPGFGEDLAADAHFSIAGEARALLDAVAEMGISSLHLVGHSYGALVDTGDGRYATGRGAESSSDRAAAARSSSAGAARAGDGPARALDRGTPRRDWR